MIEVGDSYGRLRGRSEGAETVGNPIGRPLVSTNLEPWELPETKPPTKVHTWAGPKPPTHITEDCIVWPQWERMFEIL